MYTKVEREVLWNVLKIYGVGEYRMKGIKAFYVETIACMKVEEEFSDSVLT